ncbi:hypothetical protein [Methanoregula sp.]|nr:hypothetical protein [Methanoregula sp.]
MILELSDLVVIGGMLTPVYIQGVVLLVRHTRLEQHCKDKTGYCPGE